MGKACFFIGHNDAPIHIQEALSKEIEHHIMKCNVTAKALEYAKSRGRKGQIIITNIGEKK